MVFSRHLTLFVTSTSFRSYICSTRYVWYGRLHLYDTVLDTRLPVFLSTFGNSTRWRKSDKLGASDL